MPQLTSLKWTGLAVIYLVALVTGTGQAAEPAHTLPDNGQLRVDDTKLTRGLDRQKSNDPLTAANNDTAKKYWLLGLQAFDSKEFDNAIMQIQFALQFEPTNEIF